MKRLLVALVLSPAGCASAPAPRPGQVLIFSHATGFRHASIEPGVAAVRAMVERQGRTAIASEDPAVFSRERLQAFAAIVFLSSTTDRKQPASEWLVGERRVALQAFVGSGRGIVAIHAAADSHHHWPWYGNLIGGRFQRHPPGTPHGRLNVVDRLHPATEGLPASFARTDEWYYFDNYDSGARLLVTLDPASIGARDADPNPVSWARSVDGARIFYTAMGHTPESFTDPLFVRHLEGGLQWVLGRD